MRAGDTFHLHHQAADGHLWVILSDPEQNPGRVLFVSMTSFDVDKEDVCLIQAGEHPRMTHQTCINDQLTQHSSLANLAQLVAKGIIQPQPPASADLLGRIRRFRGGSPSSTLNCSTNRTCSIDRPAPRTLRMTIHRQFASLIALLALGCSSGPLDPAHPSPRLDPGPHRGALRKVEGMDGFVEVVTEPVRDAPAGSPKFRVAVYFLDASQTASARAIPVAVTIKATWPDAPAPESIHLTIEPVPGDPAGAAKFVAPPAEHKGEVGGTLSARLGERTVTAPL